MDTISLHRYEQLKLCVLHAAKIDHVLPATCKVLSYLILKKTGNSISETTLKRLYGFALSKFMPSTFTIDVLARFCDYDSWEDFCAKKDDKVIHPSTNNQDLQLLQQNAHKITGFTLQALKNKSGIPYSQTIKRDFFDDHINEFLSSGRTGTVFAAPAGYGKTLALCHWVDEKIATDKDYIILMFSSNALMSVLLSGRDFNDWMLALLGYSADHDILALLDEKKRKETKFCLIVDGFDEYMFKSEPFRVILNQLIDIFSLHQSRGWFKLILTTRSATWVNNRHELEIGNDTWFTRFNTNDNCVNVPLFSMDEIKALCHNINPAVKSFVGIETARYLNHPLYFQFYYKQHKANFSLNNIDHLAIYELIATFILNKVYLGHYAAEKLLFIKKFVEEVDIENDGCQVDRLTVQGLIKQYYNAYQELLSTGFLRELNGVNNNSYHTYIVFENDIFLEHSIAKMLLYDNGNLFDADLVKQINKLLANSIRKVNVLKWCAIHAIKYGQLKTLDQITEASLTSTEKLDLVIFLGELIEKECASIDRGEALIAYFKQPFSENLFDYFFGLELINPEYKKTLSILLRCKFSTRKKILIYTTLAIIAIIELDLGALDTYLLKLKAFPKTEYDPFVVNPLSCLDAVYYHLKYGIIKREVLTDLTKLYFNPLQDPYSIKSNASNDMLHLLGLYTLLLSNNPKKTLRFAKYLIRNYKNNLLEGYTTRYNFFVQTLIANAYYDMGQNAKVTAIYYSIYGEYKEWEDVLTPFMKILFHSLKIKALLNTAREHLVMDEMKCINAITDGGGYDFTKIFVLAKILKSNTLSISSPEFYKQIKYEYVKIISQSDLNPKIFLPQDVLDNE